MSSNGAFLTINETAEVVGCPASVLRLWERKIPHHIKTIRHGGRRRRYRPETVEILQGIHALRRRDVPLRTIGRMTASELRAAIGDRESVGARDQIEGAQL